MKKENYARQQPKNRMYYQNLHEKFLTNARDCMASGDSIQAEYCLQRAEHFLRVMKEKFPAPPPQIMQAQRHKSPVMHENTSEDAAVTQAEQEQPEGMNKKRTRKTKTSEE